MTGWKRYRDAILVVLLLTVPFFFLRRNVKQPDALSGMDRALLQVSAPIEFMVASAARGVSGFFADYIYLVDVKGENARLSYENARLREQVHKLERAEAENRELRKLLQLKEGTPGDTVSAQVIGTDFTEFFRVTRVVLDRGSRNVREHMPVITSAGVVGTVQSVAGDSIAVQLAVDAAFGVDVEDEVTGARAFVRGTGDPTKYTCKVEMVDSRDTVDVGDLLVTSGKGKWFPRGIPVARVTRVNRQEIGRDQEVEARPTVDFSRLDAVLILTSPPGELDDGKGKAGAAKP